MVDVEDEATRSFETSGNTQRHGVTSKKTEALDYKCFANSYFWLGQWF